MLQQLIKKREEYVLKIRRAEHNSSIKKQREQIIFKLQNMALIQTGHQSKFKTLGIELMKNPNRLREIIDVLSCYIQDEDYAWCMLVCVKTALAKDPQILSMLLQSINRLVDQSNSKYIIKTGIECIYLIMNDHPKIIMYLNISNRLINFYFAGKQLQPLVIKVLICYLSICDLDFHQSLASQNYFWILKNIIKKSKHRQKIIGLFLDLFCFNIQFIELYFPIFEAFMEATLLYPSTLIFIFWRVILVQTENTYVDWMMENEFPEVAMGILKELGMDKERVLAILEWINALFLNSNVRMVDKDNIPTPQQSFQKMGLQNVLKSMQVSRQIYSQYASKLLTTYYNSS